MMRISALESTKNLIGDTSPQSSDFYDTKLPAPHRRRGLLSSLNFISGSKPGSQVFAPIPPSDSLPLHVSVGSLGRSAEPAGLTGNYKHDKSSTLISTVHSVPAGSPLKQSVTTKADAR